MGILGGILETRSGVVDVGSLSRPTSWMFDLFGGAMASSGVRVNEATAENLSTVWCCVRSISEDVAKMPFKIYRRLDENNREEAKDHPAYELLNRLANTEYMVAITVRELIMRWAMLWGNGIAEIERTRGGKPLALHPIHPCSWSYVRNRKDELVYEVRRRNGDKVTLFPEDVYHLKGPSDDGYVGIPIITKARESWGAAMAAERFASRFWANGARPSGVMQHPKKISDKARENLVKSIDSLYGGTDNAGRPMLLEEDMKWAATSVPPEDAQFLETRQYGVPEICRWFRFPPHKAGDLSRATFSNIEQQSKDYVDQCLSGWMTRNEQEADLKLLMPSERAAGKFYTKHVAAALLKGDIQARYASYAIGRQWGWLSANAVLRLEDMNDIPGEGGNQYLAPSNMTTPAKLEKAPDPGATPTPAAPAAPAAPTPPTPDPAAKREQERTHRIGCIVRAARPAMEDALWRILRVEADKASRAHKQGKLEEWKATFYQDHALFVKRDVMPVVEGIAMALVELDLVKLPGNWVAEASAAIGTVHVASSRAMLVGAEIEFILQDFIHAFEVKPVGRVGRDTIVHLTRIADQLTTMPQEGPAS